MTPEAALDAAFAAQPRERFLRPRCGPPAGTDGPLDIGHGQTSSQPRTVRAMLALLDVRPGQRVLDVGCGSGWTTALLGRLVGPTGSVLGLERVPDLVAFGRANLAAAGMPWAEIVRAAPDVLGSRTRPLRPDPRLGDGHPAARTPSSTSWRPVGSSWCRCRV